MAFEPREDVLSNEDLLGIMFGYIQTYDKPSQEFLNLALTCKTFYELALNALWKTLPSLLPLFKVLPSLILVNDTYTLEDVISDEAWARICYYGKRTRSVIIAPGSQKLSRYAYQLLALRGQRREESITSSILPNLQRITVHCNASEADYAGTFFLLGSSLTKVEVKALSSGHQDVEFCQELLVGLYQNSTKLRELSLDGTATPIVSKALSQVGRLKALNSLSLNLTNFPLSLGFLDLLGSLPVLSSLKVHAGSMNSPPSQTFPNIKIDPNLIPFPSLLNLEVVGTPSAISRTLSKALSSTLTHVHLVGSVENEQTDSQHWKDCFYRMAESCKGLLSVHVSPYNSAQLAFDITTLSPVFDMGTIQRLNLDISTVTGSGVLDKIGNSCPNLTLLALPASNAGEDNPDLSCLAFLAKTCPKLEDLSICLRLDLPQQIASAAGKALSRLRISDAASRTFGIREGLPVAELLNNLFPSLSKLEAYRNARGEGLGETETIDQIGLLVTALKGAAQRLK